MKNYITYLVALISLSVFLSCNIKQQTPNGQLDTLQIHINALTIDTHLDTPLDLVSKPDYNLEEEHNRFKSKTRLDFPRMKKGGLDAAIFIVWTAQGETTTEGFQKVKEKADSILEVIKERVGKANTTAELAYSTEDIKQIVQDNKRAILIGMENGYPLGTNLNLVNKYYDEGIRYLTLCHTKDNQLCSSSTDKNEDKGLTKFGVDVVNRMNQLGIIVDVSHISDKSFFEVLKLTKTPVIASHSNVRSLCNHPRNISDEMLKALAINGGVIQVNFVNSYLKEKEENPQRDSAFAKLTSKLDMANMTKNERSTFHLDMKKLDKQFPSKKATLTDVVNHIDYIVKLIGIDHVGIGSDFDGGGGVEGIQDVSEMANITKELLKLGYSEGDIQKIWGGNFMRVFGEVENFAK